MAAGPIRYRDVLAVHPFGNTVNQAFMKGSELTTYLGVVATKNINFGGYPQFGGITMQVDCLAKSVQITSIAGKPFDADATYRFSIPSFSAAGGDGYPVIPTRNAGATDADVLVDYLTAKKAIRAADYEPNGEVTFANSASTTGCQ
jgi:5'-nucleotidase/UDP-sugar diphosphatase